MNLGNLSLKQKIIGAVIAIGILLIAIFKVGLYNKGPLPSNSTVKSAAVEQVSDKPHLVSTNPAGLQEGIIVPSDQKIEVTFSDPIENRGEVKSKMDPPIDYEVELSSDKKTVKLLPKKPFELGRSFTFTVDVETKFENKKRLDSNQVFHFSTIAYHGV